MTIIGKIALACFLVIIGYSTGLIHGYKLFNNPQTVNEVSIGKIKGGEGSNTELTVSPKATTNNNQQKSRKIFKRNKN